MFFVVIENVKSVKSMTPFDIVYENLYFFIVQFQNHDKMAE